MYFSEALQHFDDNSIDLLHIDGLHTYDAVKEDFSTWYPKVKPGGIVLFHDVMAKIKDFGAWKYFEELESEHEEVFKFYHGFGLGVIRKPGGVRDNNQLLDIMFSENEDDRNDLRKFYTHASEFLEAKRQVKRFKPKTTQGKQGGQGKPEPTGEK